MVLSIPHFMPNVTYNGIIRMDGKITSISLTSDPELIPKTSNTSGPQEIKIDRELNVGSPAKNDVNVEKEFDVCDYLSSDDFKVTWTSEYRTRFSTKSETTIRH